MQKQLRSKISKILLDPNNKGIFIFFIISVIVVIFQVIAPHSKEQNIKNESNISDNTSVLDKKMIGTTRESFLEPNRQFYINTIFEDGQKVAEFKSDGDRIFDQTGVIPDGKIEFTDLSRSSYGLEYFKNGAREDDYTEYHSNGKIWFEKTFKHGNMMTVTEYFDDGGIRMKADYSDALKTCETPDNGSGIIYRHSGQPMYEWHLTALDTNRYKKFYNNVGTYEGTQYFDVKGRLIKDVEQNKTIPGNSP